MPDLTIENTPNAGLTLGEIAQKLDRQGIFTGGPPHLFENAGRLQVSTLVREGLYPFSRVLDVGCGCLRAGYWLVRLLDPGCYFGIEPNVSMLQAGIDNLLTPEIREIKKPSFDTNDRYDFSVFGTHFDVFLARSIWSHAPKPQIQTMLDSFTRYSSPNAFFLTSYYPASWFARGQSDYTGNRWIGRSHISNKAGQVHHKLSWVEKECRDRGLIARQLEDPPFNGQYWLKITKQVAAKT
jgi:SAM-dependent methyltransferase